MERHEILGSSPQWSQSRDRELLGISPGTVLVTSGSGGLASQILTLLVSGGA